MSAILSRRAVLQSLAVAGASAWAARHLRADDTPSPASSGALTPESFRARLRGPILSIPTPFTADFRVDESSIRSMCERAAEASVTVFALTAGNGQYAWLDTGEIRDLTRMLVKAVGSRGVVIAASDGWWTRMVAEYAAFSESAGAHAVQVMLPEGVGEDAVMKHFEEVAKASKLPIVLHGNYSESLIKRLVEIPSVAALKEDVTLDYYIQRQRTFGSRLAIFGGGSEHRFLAAWPYGSSCYYSAYAAFAPEASMTFWRAIQRGDTEAAAAWIDKYDFPFLDHWSHAFWRASMEHFGTGQRYLRPPVPYFNDDQMKEVAAFYDGLGLKPPPG